MVACNTRYSVEILRHFKVIGAPKLRVEDIRGEIVQHEKGYCYNTIAKRYKLARKTLEQVVKSIETQV